jgi:hypothetical protein
MVINEPAEILACGANVTVIDLLASGKFSDFLLGDWIDQKRRVTRVVIQVARPSVTESRTEASPVESLFVQETKMYHRELKHLQGRIVPKCFGLWVGYVPGKSERGGNTYTNTMDKLLLLITEFVPNSYDQSVDKLDLIQLPTPEHSPPPEASSPILDTQLSVPATFPPSLWSQLPPGLQECYHTISGVGINHNAHQRKHWRCDSLGRWRILDFTKATRQDYQVEYMEDIAPQQRSTEPTKTVHFEKNEKEP